ncbi:bifunctional nicotinamide-nucleotide adenylyltransferase/Nudix hydroxylase [Algicola sagamiensis]|uniref:bifunctional nicotinamide-nucleotide adenylyltransferase/Nudix hydroxylase n=1 Tax=Algicola sagamiensis TaxID=163869 RepID=UPI0003641BEE|nr:bifunctional nicotinamide-nucleotide adenylyltransferase/Nudix hydroxylase [Algicola sagamiensis]
MQHPDKYDFSVFIGRLQPPHLGHLSIIREGLKCANFVIVLLGSSHQPRTTRNPFTYEERVQMLRLGLTEEENQRVLLSPLTDILYNDQQWVMNVQRLVQKHVVQHHTEIATAKIALIGHRKDSSSYYLKLFPQWYSVDVAAFKTNQEKVLNSTQIRHALFDQTLPFSKSEIATFIPERIIEKVQAFQQTQTYQDLYVEFEQIQNYLKQWKDVPYPPIFITVDAIVVQSGHLLMVRRKHFPGKGQLALPGGFIRDDETLEEACLRELKEETRLKKPYPVLKGGIKHQRVFDAPHRSTCGRRITHAFFIELAADEQLPSVRGGDDAQRATWIPLSELDPREVFEDHYFIIQNMLGIH